MLSERQIENYLVRKVRAAGGLCYKFVSPGNSGVPDRICVFPGGRIVFAELKAESGGRLSALQRIQQSLLADLGCAVYTASSKEECDAIVAEASA